MKGRIERKRRAKHAAPAMNNRFSGELQRLVSEFKKTKSFRHAQTKGNAREATVREMLSAYLPGRFEVTSGEIVDFQNGVTPQIDVIVYNGSKNPVLLDGESSIVPAEAALVSIEVKSTLTSTELQKSLKVANKLQQIKPLGKSLSGPRQRGEAADGTLRYMHCIFAYNTDLASGDDWADREYQRFSQVAAQEGVQAEAVDRIYVADRGLLMPAAGKGLVESSLEGNALMVLCLHILNFCMREDERRASVDYENYSGTATQAWRTLRKSSP